MPFIKEQSPSETSESARSDSPPRPVEDPRYQAEVEQQLEDGVSSPIEPPLSQQPEPIAVIGMACRLPGEVNSAGDLWDMMMEERSGRNEKIPASRFNIDAHLHPDNDRPGSFNVPGGYFLDQTLREFDPSFFGIPPIEARWMDPQQRTLLEVVYETFESAGIRLEDVSGSRTGMYVASFTSDFQQMAFKEPSFRHAVTATGVDPGLISNRISQVFNMQGPSMLINTACSSSTHALHHACLGLRAGDCDNAVVGGVNLILSVDQHMNTAKLGVLSPTSECHTFDASADGYGRAEGVGAVYLKRLKDAIRDGDPIRGVIRASSINSNGKVPGAGITHPSFEGQVDVVQTAYRIGGLSDELTHYVECHGTGTAVGDPLEAHAIAEAMSSSSRSSPLQIGSIKPNIGHSEAASGLSTLIKAIMAVERGIIPPTRGIKNPSPAVDWEGWNITVPREPIPFESPLRRIGINAFGYGGTNAHVIVEGSGSMLSKPQKYQYRRGHLQGPPKRQHGMRKQVERNRPYLFLFSAHDAETLKRNVMSYKGCVDQYTPQDLSYTLANHRTHFSSRGACVVTPTTCGEIFQDDIPQLITGSSAKSPASIGFVFTGQGAQNAGMARELMVYYPSFAETITRLDDVLGELTNGPDWTLEDLLLSHHEQDRIHEAEYAQPLCTAIQVALVLLLRSWGIVPVACCGHSSGEIGAAFCAGLISDRDAIIAAYYRGQSVRKLQGECAMMAVGLSALDAEAYIDSLGDTSVVVACHNSPAGVTLSGKIGDLDRLERTFKEKEIFARRVETGGKAYHSPQMIPVSKIYRSYLEAEDSEFSAVSDRKLPTNATMVSSVTSAPLAGEPIWAEYWCKNLVNPVRFHQAVKTMTELHELDFLIEIGPHSALSGPIRQIRNTHGLSQLEYLPTLIRGQDSAACLLKLAGQLFVKGCPLDLRRIVSRESLDTGKLIVDLPPYQWDRTKMLWAESRHSQEHRHVTYPRHDILGSTLPGGSLSQPTWRNILRGRDVPWLRDHSLGGEAVFPAAGYFSMAAEAVWQMNETSPNPLEPEGFMLRDVTFQAALVIPDDDVGIETLVNLRRVPGDTQWWHFAVSSVSVENPGPPADHVSGSIRILTAQDHRPTQRKLQHLPQRATGSSWNQALRRVGFDYGPSFQDMEDIRFNGHSYVATSRTQLKRSMQSMIAESRYAIHPSSVDSCLQLLIVAIFAGRTRNMPAGAIPFKANEVSVWLPTEEQLAEPLSDALAWVDHRGSRNFVGSSQLVANDGTVVLEVSDIHCSLYEAAVPQRVAAQQQEEERLGRMHWKPDIDLLSGDVDLLLSDFVDLAAFKEPGVNVVSIHLEDRLSMCSPAVTSVNDASDIGNSLSSSSNVIVASTSEPLVLLDTIQSSVKADDRIFIECTGPSEVLPIGPLSPCWNVNAVLRDSAPVLIIRRVEEADTKVDDQETHRQVCLISRNGTQGTLERKLRNALETHNHNVTIRTLSELADVPTGSHLIFLDVAEPVLHTMTETELSHLQTMVASSSTLVWVTGGDFLQAGRPLHALAPGLLRSIRSEQAALSCAIIDLDEITQPMRAADIIANILKNPKSSEIELCISNNRAYISRLVADEFTDSNDDSPIWDQQSKPIAAQVHRPGQLSWEVDAQYHDQPLDPQEVEVRVELSGLDEESIRIIKGHSISSSFSHEIAGTVHRIGEDVMTLNPGDRVAGFSFNRFASVQRVRAPLLVKLTDSEELSDAVTRPMTMTSALYALHTLAHVQPEETVLILPGSGLVGLGCVQVAKALKARPLLMVADSSEADAVQQAVHLDDNEVWTIAQYLSNKERQLDIVIDGSAHNGTLLQELWRHRVPGARFIQTGPDGSTLDLPQSRGIQRGGSYHTFDLRTIHDLKPHILAGLLHQVFTLYRKGAIAPFRHIRKHPVSDLGKLVATLSTADLSGSKHILIHPEINLNGDSTAGTRENSSLLRADATYLLVGCLGGLGRSIASWMVSQGGRHFIFLSRSGATAPEAASLVDKMRAAGGSVQVIKGDASVLKDVQHAVASADYPIRGVVNAAMVLRDSVFPNITHESWTASISSKVHASKNLHETFTEPSSLDFFIMTSSISGILGTPGQSIYAAGNAFMDALARHRGAQGLPATSIVLPMITGVGVVAETPELLDDLARKGMYGIDDQDVLEVVEKAIRTSQTQNYDILNDHIVVGLDSNRVGEAIDNAGSKSDCFWLNDKRFSHLAHALETSGLSVSGGQSSILQTLKQISTGDVDRSEVEEVVQEALVERLAQLLLMEPDDINVHAKSIGEYGLDSMIGAEFRNWLYKCLELEIPFNKLLAPELTVGALSQELLARHSSVAVA